MGEGSISILPTRKDKTRGTCDEQNGADRESEKKKANKEVHADACWILPPLFGKIIKQLDEMIFVKSITF